MFIPEQNVSAAKVDLDGSSCLEYFNSLKDVDYYAKHGLHRFLCHLHSHCTFETFWSAVDDEQQMGRSDVGYLDDYRFYVVVNNKNDIKASLVTYRPVLSRIDAVPVIYFGGEFNHQITVHDKQELDKVMEANIHKVAAPVVPKGTLWDADAYTMPPGIVLDDGSYAPDVYGDEDDFDGLCAIETHRGMLFQKFIFYFISYVIY